MPRSCGQQITGLVLAGGRGTRMGGVDKGLQAAVDRKPLVLHALDRLRAQTCALQALAISANRNLARYQALGVPVHADAAADYAGPLAGIASALKHCTTPLLLAVPCDAPHFPLDLCARLLDALQASGAEIAVAATVGPDGRARLQPVFCLMQRRLQGGLTEFMQSGGRQVGAWVRTCEHVPVLFNQPGDKPQAFGNINTLAELKMLRAE